MIKARILGINISFRLINERFFVPFFSSFNPSNATALYQINVDKTTAVLIPNCQRSQETDKYDVFNSDHEILILKDDDNIPYARIDHLLNRIEIAILEGHTSFESEYNATFIAFLLIAKSLGGVFITSSLISEHDKGVLVISKIESEKDKFGKEVCEINGATLLADNKTLLLIENGVLYAFTTPWVKDIKNAKNEKIKITNLVLFKYDVENSIEKLSLSRFYSMLWLTNSKDLVYNKEKNFSEVIDTLAKLPNYEINFNGEKNYLLSIKEKIN